VLDASGNLMMRSIGALIGAALAAAFRLSAPSDSLETLHRSHRHHCAITDAIRARDPKAAADAMTTVIEDGWASLGERSEPTIAMIRTHLFP
jgi:DNA-binding FadR family transcriptional regulator